MRNSSESLFKALADTQRRELLRLLRAGEAPAGELATAIGISPATISHHLGILKSADLVRVRRDGRHRIYALNASAVQESLLVLTDLLRPGATPTDKGNDS